MVKERDSGTLIKFSNTLVVYSKLSLISNLLAIKCMVTNFMFCRTGCLILKVVAYHVFCCTSFTNDLNPRIIYRKLNINVLRNI